MALKTLFLIDGAAGTGKSDLLSYIDSKYARSGRAAVIRKFTTRPHRKEEIDRSVFLDLEFVSSVQFQNRVKKTQCYTYEYGGHNYGIVKSDIDEAVAATPTVFAIVRDLGLAKLIAEEYDDVRVVSTYIYSDRDRILDRLQADGYSKEAIDFRLARQELAWDDYLRHPDSYNEIVINNSSKNDFLRLVDSLISRYARVAPDELVVSPNDRFPLPKPLVGFRDQMESRLRSSPYDRNIFLMMKFRSSNRETYEFISEQIGERGYACVRADQPAWNITNDVYNPIAVLHCCKYGIALFDEAEAGNTYSPNVAYELGMMHLQRKKCLILKDNSLPDVPFDLIKDLHFSYSRDLEVRSHVVTWLETLGN